MRIRRWLGWLLVLSLPVLVLSCGGGDGLEEGVKPEDLESMLLPSDEMAAIFRLGRT